MARTDSDHGDGFKSHQRYVPIPLNLDAKSIVLTTNVAAGADGVTIVTGAVSLENQGDASHDSRDVPGTIQLALDLRVQNSAGVVEPVSMYALSKVRNHECCWRRMFQNLTLRATRHWQPNICCTTMIRCHQELWFTGMVHLREISISF